VEVTGDRRNNSQAANRNTTLTTNVTKSIERQSRTKTDSSSLRSSE
jgi:hypothetical protein